MSRKIFLLTIMLAGALLVAYPARTSAHVLIKDQVLGTGAIMHIMPDDDPVAGEEATIFFDIRDSSVSAESSQINLSVIDERGVPSIADFEITGSRLSSKYIFPRQGLYEVRLTIQQDGRTTHVFSQPQRVSRGVQGDVNSEVASAWATIGVIATALGAALMAIIAFNRRKAIQQYSKM